MRMAFVAGVVLLVTFEIANLFFIMPLPGSQRMRSLELAYALYSQRWAVRLLAAGLILAGSRAVWRADGWRRWLGVGLLAIAGSLTWMLNFRMSAERIFRSPSVMEMASVERNRVALDRLVVGIEVNGDARAYPLQFIGYHHQVRDTVGGMHVLVSYCTVCRTGRVFEPVVDGTVETFRLVGMDRFNAMLEDRSTKSWWRQANGEAVTGPRKGTLLREVPSRQVTLRSWLSLHPATLIMQGDPAFAREYAQDYAFERGTSRSRLTGTDPRSWQEKSWVVGLREGGAARAYDWNDLLRLGVINDTLGATPVVLVVAADSASFFAFIRPDTGTRFTVDGDSLRSGRSAFAFNGKGPTGALTPIAASQEFWHSWRTFVPGTTRLDARG